MSKPNLLVLKLGGKVGADHQELEQVVAHLARNRQPAVVVHGGGNLVTEYASRLGLTTTMVAGRRVTDEATRDLLVMTCAGLLNKQVVSALQAGGVPALGLSGADGALLKARVRPPLDGVDYGLVGEIEEVNHHLLHLLIGQGLAPVVSPVTWSPEAGLLNTNADTVATHIAMAMATRYSVRLMLLMQAQGVYDAEGKVIPRLGPEGIAQLDAAGALKEGIYPKLHNALQALRCGVAAVSLGSVAMLQGGPHTVVTH